MRQMKRIMIFGACMLLLAGCASQLDEIRPKHAISSESVNESDLGKLTNGVLYRMEKLAVDFWNDGDYLGENFGDGPGFTYADFHGEIESTSSAWAKSRWQSGFVALMHVNELLKSANAASDSPASMQAKGTAYFCRAFIYYQLVTRFGGVPILTSPSMDVVPISKEADVWAQIIADLNEAEKYLDSVTNVYRPSDEACWALLSKAYLWTGDTANAIVYADKVINSGKFELGDTSVEFAEMFISGNSSKEVVFSLANKRSSGFLRIFEYVNDTDASWRYSIAEGLRTTLFADTYGTSDIRKDPTYNEEFPIRIIKFPNGGQDMGQFIVNEDPSASPIVILRLADVYLTKAEAQGASAGLATMKTFMDTRYSSVSLPSSMSEKDFENLILDENNREFYGEGRRWFDIKRTGRTDLYKTWNGRDHLLYWPIPQDEIDLVGKDVYPQNPGY